MAEKNIFPVHNIQNLLDYGQLEFLKPNKKNIFMRYAMKSKRIKTYSLQDGCYQKDKVDTYAYRRGYGRGFRRKFIPLS